MATPARFCNLGKLAFTLAFLFLLPAPVKAGDFALRNQQLSCTVRSSDGSYEIQRAESARPVLRSIVAAEIDNNWVRSIDYPRHEISNSKFEDQLGQGRQVSVLSTGLAQRPDLQ